MKTPRRDGGARLLALRERLGMSQRELADEFRVTAGAIAHWEAGRRVVPGPLLLLVELYERDLDPGPAPPASVRAPRPGSSATAVAAWLIARGALGPTAGGLRGRVRLAATHNLVATVRKHRGIGMKLAQLIGYLDFVLPEPERALLAALQTSARPLPAGMVTSQLLRAFGRTPRQLFADWNPTPFAIGSIGQVHAARTHGGEEIAVKVSDPGARLAERGGRARAPRRSSSSWRRPTR